ncbi:MAG: TlpA family protein disulfide reductase [Janthinobacterium lividum]
MEERTKLLLAVLLVVSAFAILFTSVQRSKIADEATPGLIEAASAKAAPPFAIADAATGKLVTLQDETRAQPVVLDFWATWCGPCRAELPHLEDLSHYYQGKVAFYGVNSNDTPKVITQFARKNNLTFSMLSDADQHVGALYGAQTIPLLIVIDTHGRVRAVTDGYSENVESELSRTLDALLAEEKQAH